MEKESIKKVIKYTILIPTVIVFGYFIFVKVRNEISNTYFNKGLEKPGKEGIPDINTAIKINPKNITFYIEKAKRLEKTQEALNVLNKAIEICPSLNDTSYYNRNEFRYDAFDFAFENIYSIRARLNISFENYDAAIEDYTKMTNYQYDYGFSGYYNRGYVYYLKNEYDKAESDLRIANDIYNKRKVTKIFMGLDNYVKLFLCILDYKKGNYNIALKSLNEIIISDGSKALYKATILAKSGDYENSVSNYEIYFKANTYLPQDLDYHISQKIPTPFIVDNECAAKACVNLGRFDDAISLDYSNADAHLGKGIKMYNNNNEDAITELTTAIDLNPTLSEAYIKRGVLKYRQKDYEGAISDLSSLDLKNDSDAYYARVYSYFHLKNYSQAIMGFNKLLESNLKNDIIAEIYYYRGIAKYNSSWVLDGVSDLNIAKGLGNEDAAKTLREIGY